MEYLRKVYKLIFEYFKDYATKKLIIILWCIFTTILTNIHVTTMSIIEQFTAAMQQTFDPRFMRSSWYSTGQPRDMMTEREKFHKFVEENWLDICRVMSQFKIDPETGKIVNADGTELSGTTYNDYYKLSMMMTIYLQQLSKNSIGITTFGLDIRDAELRKMLAEDKDGIIREVVEALHALKSRPFDYNVILATVAGKPFEDFFKSDAAKAIFFNADGTPRTLISAEVPADAPVHYGTCIYNCPINPEMLDPGQVAIAVFMAPDAKTGEVRLHIEATGEWNKDSFLETTMMQAVYQVALQRHLKERGCTFGQWLYEALFRFYLSTTFAGTNCPEMTGFLFAGRRTGHFLLLLLQALLAKRIPNSKIAGTSSFDAWYVLTTKMGFTNIIPPVGTHAHEIQMGAQALFANFDLSPANPEFLPLSACISTLLYLYTAHKGGPGPMPMLPDTLGTEAFMKAAAAFMVHPMKDGQLDTTQWVSLLSLITSARQDSGKLEAFVEIMKKYGCKCGLFASEIDELKTFLEASALGYKFFGAGGALGDSEKVWNVTGEKAFSASMAVKIIRMWLLDPTTGSWVRCRSPVKLGDGNDPVKVTTDPLLHSDAYQQVITEAERVKRSAIEKPVSSNLFYCELIENQIHIRRDDGLIL
jgi:nicotinic acid phosphoribosyltransferase